MITVGRSRRLSGDVDVAGQRIVPASGAPPVKQRADDQQDRRYTDKDREANDAAAVTRTPGSGGEGIEHHDIV